MTFYESQIKQLGSIVYANQYQLDTVIATRNYILNHFDKNLNLELLAHLRFTSKFHLLRLFKRYYGQTPGQYLIDIRIEKSKALLKSGASVSDSCYAVGFDSPASFSTLFKSRTGLTPSAFKKKSIFAKQD
jgi:AraC-like DNA-binding protein